MKTESKTARRNRIVAEWKEKVATDQAWALRALLRVYEEQTAAEKVSLHTIEDNGVGFSGTDGDILTSFADFYLNRGYLADKQMRIVYKRMPKYCAQLYRLTQE